MRFRKSLLFFLVLSLSIIVCRNSIFAEDSVCAENESIKVASFEEMDEKVYEVTENAGNILEKEFSFEKETLCSLKKTNKGQNLTKGENDSLFGIFCTVFYDKLGSENDINSPLSVYVCTGENRRE